MARKATAKKPTPKHMMPEMPPPGMAMGMMGKPPKKMSKKGGGKKNH